MTTTVENTEQFELTLPFDSIADPDRFEAARVEAYKTTLEDPQARTDALQVVLDETDLRDGTKLGDEILDILTSPDEERLEKAKSLYKKAAGIALSQTSEHSKPELDGVRVVFGQDARPMDIQHVQELTRDRVATEKSQRVADRTGWGPTQNGLSRRGSVTEDGRPGSAASH